MTKQSQKVKCVLPEFVIVNNQVFKALSYIVLSIDFLIVCHLGYKKAERFIKIDDCLDGGGRWNYKIEQCEN